MCIGCVNGEKVYAILFVDDGLVMSKSGESVNKFINILKSRFDITTSERNVFVGVNIIRDRTKRLLFLHQSNYVNKVLNKFSMENENTVYTPLETSLQLKGKESSEKLLDHSCF